jgi:hypothetical protein
MKLLSLLTYLALSVSAASAATVSIQTGSATTSGREYRLVVDARHCTADCPLAVQATIAPPPGVQVKTIRAPMTACAVAHSIHSDGTLAIAVACPKPLEGRTVPVAFTLAKSVPASAITLTRCQINEMPCGTYP